MRETLGFPQLFHCPAQVTSCTLLSHEGILPLPEAPAVVRGSGVSFSRWCSCAVLSLTVFGALGDCLLVKWRKGIGVNFCVKTSGVSRPFSDTPGFFRHPHPPP